MHYKEVKAILSPQNGMNLYRGCTHGCIYCDSRSKCYRMDHDFEDIEVKLHAPDILERTLKRKRTKGMIITGSMTDPYVPLEKELQMTRLCLNQIERFDFGITIQTKSDLILRYLCLPVCMHLLPFSFETDFARKNCHLRPRIIIGLSDLMKIPMHQFTGISMRNG